MSIMTVFAFAAVLLIPMNVLEANAALSKPGEPRVSLTDAYEVTLTWAGDSNRIIQYAIEYGPHDVSWSHSSIKTVYTPANFVNNANQTIIISGITMEQEYDFRVRAINADYHISPPSDTASFTISSLDSRPEAPTGVNVDVTDLPDVTILWTAPHIVGISPITHYAIQYGPHSASWDSDDITLLVFPDPTLRSHLITGLPSGESIDFRIFAINAAGVSPASMIHNIKT